MRRIDEGYALVRARKTADLIQAELAVRLGTAQLMVPRLEGGPDSSSTATLCRCAKATGTRPTVDLVASGG